MPKQRPQAQRPNSNQPAKRKRNRQRKPRGQAKRGITGISTTAVPIRDSQFAQRISSRFKLGEYIKHEGEASGAYSNTGILREYTTYSGKLSPELAQYARQIMLPGTVSAPSPLPSSAPHRCATRMITQEFVVDATNFSADGTTTFILDPDFNFGGLILDGNTRLIPAVSTAGMVMRGVFSPGAASSGTISGPAEFEDHTTADNKALMPPLLVTYGASSHTAWPIYCYTNSTVSVVVTPRTTIPGSVRLVYVSGTAGSWAVLARSPYFRSQPMTDSVTINANSSEFGFYFEDSSGAAIWGAKWSCEVKMDFAGGAQLSTQPVDHLFTAFPRIVVDEQVEEGRLAAMSMLVTNTSAEMFKSGQIYMARVPKAELVGYPRLDTVFSKLSENYKYTGKAETGGYAYWCPSDARLNSLLPVNDALGYLKQETLLVCQIRSVNLTQAPSFKVRCNWIYDFYTPNQLFEKRATPEWTEEYGRMLQVVAQMPAASCNPEHFEAFKNLIKRGLAGAQQLGSHFEENKELYSGLSKVLLGLLA